MSGFIIASEFAPSKYQVWVVATILTFDNNSIILASIWWGYIDKHTIYLFFVPLILLAFFGLGYFWVPESPWYYFEKKEFENCRNSIWKIARVNKVDLPDFKFHAEVESEDTTTQSFALLNQPKRDIIRNLTAVVLVDVFCSFNIYLILFYTKYLKGIVFNNNIYSAVGQNIALFTSGLL